MSKSEQKKDWLVEDPDIPNQRFCCLSFIEPRDMRLVAKKETFMATHFITKFLEEYEIAKEFTSNSNNPVTPEIKQKLNLSFENIQDLYKSYRKVSFTELTENFDKKHNPKEGLTVSGVKVRGSFRNITEAQERANDMREHEPAVDVLVGQVGYWLPYDPENMEDIKAQFREEQLNEIYGKKQESLEKAKVDFGDRTQDLMDKNQKEQAEKKKLNASEAMKALTESQSHQEHKNDVVIIDADSGETTTHEVRSPAPSPESTEKKEKSKPQPAKKVGNMRVKNKKH